jgi:hypothetical protein
MKKFASRIAALAAAVSLLISAIPMTSYAVESDEETVHASGTCGYGVEWEVDDDLLTISLQADYPTKKNRLKIGDLYYTNTTGSTEYFSFPWDEYADSIKHVDIKEGIKSVYLYQFADYTNLETVNIPASCEYIGSYAIPDNVKEVHIAGDETQIEPFAITKYTTIYGLRNSESDFNCLEQRLTDNFVAVGEAEVPYENITGGAGNDAVWNYDITTKTLTISGTGTIAQIDKMLHPKYIENIVIEEGITAIDGSFGYRFKAGETYFIGSITLPSTLTSVTEGSFSCLLRAVNTADNTSILDYAYETDIEDESNIPDLNYGDINNDGVCASTADEVLLLKYLVKGASLSDEQMAVADTNLDGELTMRDVMVMIAYNTRSIDTLPWTYDYVDFSDITYIIRDDEGTVYSNMWTDNGVVWYRY